MEAAEFILKLRKNAHRLGNAGDDHLEISDWLPDHPGQTAEQKTQEFASNADAEPVDWWRSSSRTYPLVSLRWNSGVNSWMVYGTGDIPVGNYNPSNLANLGIGHGAADGGAGYTYFDPKTGHEFSVVTGFTYNLINESTGYQNAIDWHLDWGASQFLTKQLLVGAVG